MSHFPHALPPLDDVLAGARLLNGLPGLLRHPISVEQARLILRRRLEQRESAFLAGVRHRVYGQPVSPYRRLLELAGCEPGDLERLVSREGVEGTLGALFRQGVYLTLDEFKGRRPVVRGSASFVVHLDHLHNRRVAPQFPLQTSGSRGPGTPIMRDLRQIRALAVNRCLVLAARGALDWPLGVWKSPGLLTVHTIEFAAAGARPDGWFTLVDPATPGLPARYRWSMRLVRWFSRLAGIRLPAASYAPLSNPLPVARWATSVLQAGGVPHLSAFSSAVVRVCQAAAEAGIDLRGTQVTMGGEPVTPARLAAIRQVGATVVPRYDSVEVGAIGHGCLTPEAADDNHLAHDSLALIQPGLDGPAAGLPEQALLLSSLSPVAPVTLLNVALGDQAILAPRRCGCPLESLGWTTHLHTIRSFAKLTPGAVTLPDTDIIRLLEEVLPARFGGAPTDYQLVEDEAEDGRPRLRLLIHPAVGPLDPDVVADALLGAISVGRGSEPVFGLMLRDAGILRVEREPPRTTPSGKILHLYLNR